MNRVKLLSIFGILVTSSLLNIEFALAGPYTDDLAKCLVRSTTDDDKNSLVKWVFAVASLHPAVMPLASISDSQREDLDKKTAELFVNLVTNTCRFETQEAAKYEGREALQASFQVLGQVAIRGMFSDPHVVKGLSELNKYIDKNKLKEITAPAQ